MVVHRVMKLYLKRIVKATGGTFCTSLSNLEREESFDANMVVETAAALQDFICDDELLMLLRLLLLVCTAPRTRTATRWSGGYTIF